jgi:hypothetical protein
MDLNVNTKKKYGEKSTGKKIREKSPWKKVREKKYGKIVRQDRTSSGHVTLSFPVKKAPLGRILHNFRLCIHRTYFRTGPLPVIIPVLFGVFFQYYFSVFFFRPFLLVVVVQNVGWGCSLRRPRPIAIGNYHPFYFHILSVLYDVRVLYP